MIKTGVMIPKFTSTWDTSDWQIELGRAINDPKTLFEVLELPLRHLAEAQNAHRLFPLRVPRPFVERMEKGNLNDPLLRQVLPLGSELINTPNFLDDPVGDRQATAQPGLVHKYQGRILLMVTGACGIHCRYCFRRHYDYQGNNPLGRQWQQTLEYLNEDDSIFEVILSGGDPLNISDRKLISLIESLGEIPHLKYLRVHTRLPVTLPQRITPQLIDALSGKRFKTSLVLHINHPNELDSVTGLAIGQLQQHNIQLLNQTVLLKGVNDSVATLAGLSHVLYANNILPYYLHTLDRVQGAGHFALEDDRAKELHTELHKQLPGYLVPRLVREIAGQAGKTLL